MSPKPIFGNENRQSNQKFETRNTPLLSNFGPFLLNLFVKSRDPEKFLGGVKEHMHQLWEISLVLPSVMY